MTATPTPTEPASPLEDFGDWCITCKGYTTWRAPKWLSGQQCCACLDVDTLYRRLS